MSSLLALPFRPVLNQAGNFESGATLTVFKTGSSTLQPIFSDEELTTPLSNPLTADSYGVFPSVYYDSEQPIRVYITESNGTVLFEVDPYISTVFDAEEVLDQVSVLVANVAEAVTEAQAAAASAAVSEAISTAFAGPRYDTVSEGLLDTDDGDFFYVIEDGVIEVYLNDNDTGVLQYSILSASQVQDALDAKADTVHSHTISNVTGLQAALDAKAPLVSPALTGTPTVNGVEVGTRSIPRSTTATTLVADDRGKCVAVSADITIPNTVFSAGHAVSIYNDSASPITITQGAGLTLRLAGSTTTGNRTLASRGMATMWFNSASEAIISGPGVS